MSASNKTSNATEAMAMPAIAPLVAASREARRTGDGFVYAIWHPSGHAGILRAFKQQHAYSPHELAEPYDAVAGCPVVTRGAYTAPKRTLPPVTLEPMLSPMT